MGYNPLNPNGQATMANSQPVVLPSDQIVSVNGRKISVTKTFIRPANNTVYSDNDVVSDNATTTTPINFDNFARVVNGSGYIVGARLSTNLKSINPPFRVHVYNTAAYTVSGDNLPMQSKYADFGNRIGYFDLPPLITCSDTSSSDESEIYLPTLRVPFITVGSRSIFITLETLTGFTPSISQQFSLQLMAELD